MQKEEFEAVVTVNVTILLVITTLSIGVSNSLPRTAYIKMIEIFLMFSMFMPFSEVLLITAIDVLRYVSVGVSWYRGVSRIVLILDTLGVCRSVGPGRLLGTRAF